MKYSIDYVAQALFSVRGSETTSRLIDLTVALNGMERKVVTLSQFDVISLASRLKPVGSAKGKVES